MTYSGVSKAKLDELKKRMRSFDVEEKDLVEKFIKSSGPGGRKRDTSSCGVYLKHEPTGIEVRCAAERSQSANRFLARRRLTDKIASAIHGEKTKKKQEIEKIRRRKKRRSRRAKEKILEEKKKNAIKKNLRKPPELPGNEEA